MKFTSNTNAWAAYIAVAFFWGTTFLAIRIGVQTMPPFLMAGLRHFIAGLLIFSFFIIKGYKLPTWAQLKVSIINGILLLVIGNGLVSWAEMYISSGLTALICALSPLMIIGANALIGNKEKLTWMVILGIVLCFGAQFIIFKNNIAQLADPNYIKGIVFLLIAIMSWGFGSIYVKQNQTGLHPLFGASFQMLSAGFILVFFGTAIGEWNSFLLTNEGVWSIVYLVIFGSVLTFIAFIYALQHLPAEISSIYSYINPIIAVILGAIIFGESLNAAIAIGGTVTLTGLYIVNYSMRKGRKQTSILTKKPVN